MSLQNLWRRRQLKTYLREGGFSIVGVEDPSVYAKVSNDDGIVGYLERGQDEAHPKFVPYRHLHKTKNADVGVRAKALSDTLNATWYQRDAA